MSDEQANSSQHPSRRDIFVASGSLLAMAALSSVVGKSASAQTAGAKPNILVIWGDDIGMWNVGAYANGMMGRTPNIHPVRVLTRLAWRRPSRRQ
jgi:arylsulfatase